MSDITPCHSRSTYVGLVVAFIIGFAVRHALDVAESSSASRLTEVAERVTHADRNTIDSKAKLSPRKSPLGRSAAIEHATEPYQSERELSQVGEYPASMDERIEHIKHLIADQSARGQRQMSKAVQDLMNSVRREPDSHQVLLTHLAEEQSDLKDLLLSVLVANESPEASSQALLLAQQGQTLQERLLGLELLSHARNQDKETRAALVDILQANTYADEDTAVATLSALGRRGLVVRDDQERIIAAVKPYIQSTAPKVREQGIRLLGEWGPGDAAVTELIVSATQDSNPQVRLGALETLGQGGFRFNEVGEAIVARLQDAGEDQEVRMAAARALEQFPMDRHTYAVYEAFTSSLQSAKPDPS